MLNMGLKGKFFSVVALLIGLIVSVGGISYFALQDVVTQYDHVASYNLDNTEQLGTMLQEVAFIRGSLYRLVLVYDNPTDRADILERLNKNIATYDKIAGEYEGGALIPGESEVYAPIKENWGSVKKATLEIMEKAKTGTKEAGVEIRNLAVDFGNVVTTYRTSMNKLNEFEREDSKKSTAGASATARRAIQSILLVICVGLLFGGPLSYVITTKIVSTLTKISAEINGSAEQVSQSSHLLSTASQQVSAGVSESASSLEETSASLEEISSMIKLNADNAAEAASLSSEGSTTAVAGESEVRKLISSMEEISRSSKQIAEIINVIDDIAFQTNLLALNAAVEAARAGDQGRGFAVVADAVRTLAQKSAEAAKDITGLISESVDKINEGSKIADSSGEVLKNIVNSIQKVSSLNTEIANASKEQANGITQIGSAMSQLDISTQQNAAASESVASTSEESSAQAGLLSELATNLNSLIFGGGASAPKTPQKMDFPTKISEKRPKPKNPKISANKVTSISESKFAS